MFRIAWKALLWVTEVHTRQRRGCPRIENTYSLSAWKTVPDFYLCNLRDVLPSRQYIERDIVIPAHPRYTRMYGVTHSIAFQAIPYFRNSINRIIVTGAFIASLHHFSSILNKVNQPEINAYCYAIETISRPYLTTQFIRNNLIIFFLGGHKQD